MNHLDWTASAGDRTGSTNTTSARGPETSWPAPARMLWGAAVVSGVAAGRVRHVETAAEAAALGPDDVAVISALSPALSAHLGGVAAVIAETGSMLCTGATLLRERGVAAVVAPGAWTHLQHGHCVVVDGVRGTVWVGARLVSVGDALK